MLQDLVRSATAAPPVDPAGAPERVVLTADRTRLQLVWNGQGTAEIAASRLRAACRCAWCTRARHDGTFEQSFAAVAIDRIVPIGGYAINIAFDDDHARGIFPWAFLRALAQAPDGQGAGYGAGRGAGQGA